MLSATSGERGECDGMPFCRRSRGRQDGRAQYREDQLRELPVTGLHLASRIAAPNLCVDAAHFNVAGSIHGFVIAAILGVGQCSQFTTSGEKMQSSVRILRIFLWLALRSMVV
jgi:hypothetical protein